MSLFERISAQMQSIRLPLFSVSVSALPCVDTPMLLLLHWHGFRSEGPQRLPHVLRTPVSVPASALQINERWLDFAALERDLLDAAWQLGAWNLERDERRACNTIGASAREALECRQAFGDFPPVGPASALVEDAPDRQDMLQMAAQRGYVRWQFHPVAGGVWEAREGDDTLEAGGHRAPPCPVVPLAVRGGKASRTIYRLGCVSRLIS